MPQTACSFLAKQQPALSCHHLLIQQCLAAGTEEGTADSNAVAQYLLLDFLADRQQQKDAALSASASSFLTCRLFADELTALRSAGTASGDQQLQLLRRYQSLAEQLGKGLKCAMNAGKPDHVR